MNQPSNTQLDPNLQVPLSLPLVTVQQIINVLGDMPARMGSGPVMIEIARQTEEHLASLRSPGPQARQRAKPKQGVN